MATKVAFLGPAGATFGHRAAKKAFKGKRGVVFIPCSSHNEVVRRVGEMEVDYGVVAVENVIDGLVTETIHSIEDYTSKNGVFVHGETVLPIDLQLFRKEESASLPRLVLTHQSPVGQCRRFIAKLQELGVEVGIRSSTGSAAEEASNNPEIAVIASPEAGKKYKLHAVDIKKMFGEDHIADSAVNYTRFWILNKNYHERTGNDKTCFLINLTQTEKGALWKTLGHFASKENAANLLIVYPHPIPGKPWEYTFFMEFAGHIDDPEISDSWSTLRASGLSLSAPRLLGSYPNNSGMDND